MLKNLTIENYALISKLEINLNKGFSVITGETGAGKSIIIGALSLVLGQRADSKSIKQGNRKCVIEGIFDISSYNLNTFFQERDLDFDRNECILRREVWHSGKSRAFINDTPVNLSDLKELGAYLIDIHSQHQNLLLGNNNFQLQVIDTLAGNKKLRENFRKNYLFYLEINKQIKEIKEKAIAQHAEQDYLRFQFEQISDAKLEVNEQKELEEELETLSHLDEIKKGLFHIEQLLNDEKGIVSFLKESIHITSALKKIYPVSENIYDRLHTSYIELKDLVFDINRQNESLELDPERLDWINERLNLIYTLEKKHHLGTIEELNELKNSFSLQLEEIENCEEKICELEKQQEVILNEVLSSARKLSKSRKTAISFLDKELSNKVKLLGMPAMKFVCQYQEKQFPDASGLDEINFLFTANKNTPLMPIAEIASGGEISRLMLGIKSLIAGTSSLPTIIFDEIDTGVSGEIADKMGTIMHEMGNVMQVIAITHLPQIAAKGNYQYFVYKQENNKQTETRIRLLSIEERVRDIAQMLSGATLTDAAIKNAKELLKQKKENERK